MDAISQLIGTDEVLNSFWRYLIEVLATPRPSTDFDGVRKDSRLDKIRHLINSVAVKNNWLYQQDTAGNVVIRTKKESAAVCMQGHLDIVVSADEPHDFENEGIQVDISDSKWLVPKKRTTLGADNGVAIACALAVMEKYGKSVCLEALFTCDEETTFRGALEVQGDLVTAPRLLNLDSEQDGEICIGCAGGFEQTVKIPINWKQRDVEARLVEVKVSGLRGGHSGIDINKGRVNAIKAIASILSECAVVIVHFSGGGAPNVIPREAVAVIVANEDDIKKLKHAWDVSINRDEEPDAVLTVTEVCADPKRDCCSVSSQSLSQLIGTLPHGVLGLNALGEVETSINLSLVTVDREVSAHFFARSSNNNEFGRVAAQLGALGKATDRLNAFPGWSPNPQSTFTRLVAAACPGGAPKLYSVHAGLECGALLARLPTVTDCASIGPTILGAHSPAERLSIESSRNFVRWVESIIQAI